MYEPQAIPPRRPTNPERYDIPAPTLNATLTRDEYGYRWDLHYSISLDDELPLSRIDPMFNRYCDPEWVAEKVANADPTDPYYLVTVEAAVKRGYDRARIDQWKRRGKLRVAATNAAGKSLFYLADIAALSAKADRDLRSGPRHRDTTEEAA